MIKKVLNILAICIISFNFNFSFIVPKAIAAEQDHSNSYMEKRDIISTQPLDPVESETSTSISDENQVSTQPEGGEVSSSIQVSSSVENTVDTGVSTSEENQVSTQPEGGEVSSSSLVSSSAEDTVDTGVSTSEENQASTQPEGDEISSSSLISSSVEDTVDTGVSTSEENQASTQPEGDEISSSSLISSSVEDTVDTDISTSEELDTSKLENDENTALLSLEDTTSDITEIIELLEDDRSKEESRKLEEKISDLIDLIHNNHQKKQIMKVLHSQFPMDRRMLQFLNDSIFFENTPFDKNGYDEEEQKYWKVGEMKTDVRIPGVKNNDKVIKKENPILSFKSWLNDLKSLSLSEVIDEHVRRMPHFKLPVSGEEKNQAMMASAGLISLTVFGMFKFATPGMLNINTLFRKFLKFIHK